MKKLISIFLIIGVMITMAFASPTYVLAAEGNTVLVMKGRENTQTQEIEIDVTVEENTGVCGMLLSLVYDTSVFTLIGVEFGTALASLTPIHTNTETDQGYGIYPFKITYLGEENDTSTGNMMTLHFCVKQDAPDGSYTITLRHERDQDVTYLKDNQILTKNLLIDGAKVTLSENKITSIDTITDNEQNGFMNPEDGIWLPIVIGSLVLISAACLFISLFTKRNKLKKWKKL